MDEQIKITKTKYAISVTCKCGCIVAVTMIYGGVPIGEDFTDTMAEAVNAGGKLEIVNAYENPLKLGSCTCLT